MKRIIAIFGVGLACAIAMSSARAGCQYAEDGGRDNDDRQVRPYGTDCRVFGVMCSSVHF